MKTSKKVLGLVCVMMGFVACGGGGSNPPVYNDRGECIANCPVEDVIGGDNLPDAVKDGLTDEGVVDDTNLPDALVDNYEDNEQDLATDIMPQDTPYRDCGAGITDMAACPPEDVPETDLGAYTCPDPENPSNECKPQAAREAICYDFSGDGSGKFFCSGGFFQNVPCTTDAECQEVLPDFQYPPCVCWSICWLPMMDETQTWYCNGQGDPEGDEPWNNQEFKFGNYFDNGSTCKLGASDGYYNYSPETGSLEAEPWMDYPARYIVFNNDKSEFQILKKSDGTLLYTCTSYPNQ